MVPQPTFRSQIPILCNRFQLKSTQQILSGNIDVTLSWKFQIDLVSGDGQRKFKTTQSISPFKPSTKATTADQQLKVHPCCASLLQKRNRKIAMPPLHSMPSWQHIHCSSISKSLHQRCCSGIFVDTNNSNQFVLVIRERPGLFEVAREEGALNLV